MSKKVISIVLSAAMLVAMFCVGFGAVTASADAGDVPDSATYYFLAPDNYFKTDKGAANEEVGVWYWGGTSTIDGAWPGPEATPAPEVGENVFKYTVEGGATGFIFNAHVDAGDDENKDPELAKVAHQTADLNTEGYNDVSGNDCPYDASFTCDNFDGMIFVINFNLEPKVNEMGGAETRNGAWFTLDNYKNYDEYYGSYGFASETADSDTTTTEPTSDADVTPAPTADGDPIHAGDTVTVEVQFGNFPAATPLLGAFNYDVSYDSAAFKFIPNEVNEDDEDLGVLVKGKGASMLSNPTDGKVGIAAMAPYGFKGDYTGAPVSVYTFKLEATAATTTGAIAGVCSSLSGVKSDASGTEKLLGAGDNDTFSNLKLTVECPHEPDTDTAVDSKVVPESKPESKPTDSSKNDSSKSNSSATSSKSTGDNASKSTSSGKGTAATTAGTSTATVQTAGTFAVVSLVVILMAAAAVVLYTRKKTEE